jgi:hypothetical protein
MSATIIPFLDINSFDAATTRAMGEAYDKAYRMLHDKGQPHIVQEVIARSVIKVAKTGERDPDKICERVLTMFGLQTDP